jgi:hypothetical protein
MHRVIYAQYLVFRGMLSTVMLNVILRIVVAPFFVLKSFDKIPSQFTHDTIGSK